MKSPLPLLLPLICILAASDAGAATPRAKPDIIFILADDLGWTDLGCQGSRYYETPNIDRLAAQGMRFTGYHHCQNCAPTRAALMSGQYGPRTGIYTVGGIDRFDWHSRPLKPVENATELPLDRRTIADQLKASGYATAMFGKWHLGEKEGHHPAQRGFDEALVSQAQHINFKTNPPTDIPPGAYLADFLTDKAADFIRRNKDHPFFLYLPHFAVHSPYQAKPELIEKFKTKPPVGGHHDPVYAAMISSLDESVGRIMALLDELQLTDDTVLLFASDNGGVGGYQREGIDSEGVTDNAPLRSGKGSLYEGGTRVPLIIRWPGNIKPGSTCAVPAIHVDMYPTFLEISGAAAPEGQPLDGESLVPLLRDPAAALHRKAIFQHFPGYLGIGVNQWRTTPVSVIQAGDWKLMEFLEDRHLELYNLRDDLGESTNLAATLPEKAAELCSQLNAWRSSIGAPMPAPNTDVQAPAKPGKSGKKKNKKAATSE